MPVGHYGHRGRKTKMHQTPPRPARWPNGSSTIDSPLFSSGVLCLCLLFIPVSSTPKAGEFGVRCDNRRRQFHPKKWHHRPDKWAIVARDMPVLVREIAVEKLVDCCCWWWCCHCDRRNGAQDELEFLSLRWQLSCVSTSPAVITKERWWKLDVSVFIWLWWRFQKFHVWRTILAHIVRMVVNNILIIKTEKVVMPMGVWIHFDIYVLIWVWFVTLRNGNTVPMDADVSVVDCGTS